MTKQAWWNDYQRIPYKIGGRDRDGLDCWGLVRLIYAEQFQREIPSLTGDYDNLEDVKHLHELVARDIEQWTKVELAECGDIVLFNHAGAPHVGIITEPGKFLHIRAGTTSLNERLSSPHWRSRIRGFYRYSPKPLPLAIHGFMHPLKTERIDMSLPQGRTISQIIAESRRLKKIDPSIPIDAHVWINGHMIEQEMWDHMIPSAGSRVDIRAVPQGSGQGGRSIAMLAVMIIAMVLAPYLAPVFAPLFGAAATQVAGAVLTFAGTMLVNAIFPIRQPDQPGQAKQQYLLQGSSNQQNQYGAIPAVFGRVRYAPPLGAKPYTEMLAEESFMRLALIWGYGPLQIGDLRIGQTPVEEYEDVEVVTLEGTVQDNFTKAFSKIYGRDLEQIQPGIEMLCPAFDCTAVESLGIYTVTVPGGHGYSTGATAWLSFNRWEPLIPGFADYWYNEVIDKGEITVTGPNTFTMPVTVTTKYGPGLAPDRIDGAGYSPHFSWIIDGDPYWTATHGVLTLGDLTLLNAEPLPGKTYEITFTVSAVNGTGVRSFAGGTLGALVAVPGTYTQTIVAGTNAPFGIRASADSGAVITYFQVRRKYVPGDLIPSTINRCRASAWTEEVLNEEVEQISVTFHFPEGLRSVADEGGKAGNEDPAHYLGRIQIRQLDSNTLVPLTPWGDIEKQFSQTIVDLPTAWYNIDDDDVLEEVYQWHRFSLNERGKVLIRPGAITTNPAANPSGDLLTRLQNDNYGLNVTFTRLPVLADGEEPLWDVCMKGNAIFSTVDHRDVDISGAALTSLGRRVTIASGSIIRAQDETIRLGGEGQPYYIRKDAFSYSVNFNVPQGIYEIRTRRENESNQDFLYVQSGNDGTAYHRAFLQSIAGFSDRRPMNPPKPISASAIRIKATNQLNGNTEAFIGTATSIAKDWDHVALTWVERPTRNPASLYRLALQHPGNARRVPDSQIMLDELVEFHNFCRINKFMYDAVHMEQRPLWDVLADICAAGRASPTRRDARWSVVIDKPRTTVAQIFTPHNSWGFSGVKNLPKQPHAFRVEFINSERAYQPDEMLVYNDGYSAANATNIEGLNLPGVTTPQAVHKHARMHMAQLKLRSESYNLNVDWEHLICTRGDRVEVNHYVPMWGIGSARVTKRYSNFRFRMSDPLPQAHSVVYGIRIRSKDGTMATRQLQTLQPWGLQGFQRNSVATYINNLGDLVTYQIHEPRYAPNGSMVIENAATNMVRNSQMAGSVIGAGNRPNLWVDAGSPSNLVRTLTGFNFENGRVYVEFHFTGTPNASAGYGVYIENTANGLSGETWTASCEAKAIGALTGVTSAQLVLQERTAGGVQLASSSVNFNLGTLAAAIQPQQVTRVYNQPTTAKSFIGFLINFTNGVAVNAKIRLYCPQLELGAQKTSFFPTIAAIGTRLADDYVENTLLLETAASAAVLDRDDLVAFGLFNEETVDAIVLAIEPSENECAQLSLVDYAPVVYDSDLEVIPPFDSQITEPPIIQDANIRVKPTITAMRSDESIMSRLPSGAFDYGIRISWQNPSKIPRRVNGVQAQIDIVGGKLTWYGQQVVDVRSRSCTFMGLRQGRSYQIRMRYVDQDGRTGPWIVSVAHQVVGKTTPPRAVTGLNHTIEDAMVELDWRDNPEIDIKDYEIRIADSGWGDDNYLFRVRSSKKVVAPPPIGTSRTWFIRARDYANLYSATSASTTLNHTAVPQPGVIIPTVSASSTTTDMITFNWPDSAPVMGLRYYECILTMPDGVTTRVSNRRVSDWTMRFDWVGIANLSIKAVDSRGNKSVARTLAVTKLVPGTVGVVTVTVNGLRLIANWPNLAKTTLPIAGYEIRTADSGWGNSTPLWRGDASIHAIPGETLVVGVNTFYIRAFDTDGQYSGASRTFSYTRIVPTTPVIDVPVYADTASTDATVSFNWSDSASAWGIDYYTVTLTLPSAAVRTFRVKGSEWTTRANWVGASTLRVKAHDRLGSQSAEAVLVVTKSPPNNVGSLSKVVDKRLITISWAALAKTTLPIAGYEIRSADTGWGTDGFLFRGTARTMRAYQMALGLNVFYAKAFDTDGQYSAGTTSISHTYAVPPNLTTVSVVRRRRNLNFTTTGPATPSDFSHYEFRIKLGGPGGDVWAAYDVAVKSQHPNYDGHTISAFGTYNISARMFDTDGNSSAASVNTSIVVSQLPAP